MSRLPQPCHIFDAGVAEVSTVAIEAAIELAQRGVAPIEIMAALGISWRSLRAPGWYDVQLALSSAWRGLQRGDRTLREAA